MKKRRKASKVYSKPTRVIPVRLLVTQLEALKTLPPEISVSALTRALLQFFLDGSLPVALRDKIWDEVARTNTAIRNGQLKRKEQKEHEQQHRPSLREKLYIRLSRVAGDQSM